MNQRFLKDQKGKIIGVIITHDDGNKRIQDPNGRVLGFYNKELDMTKESSGRMIGKGDLLTTLLK